MYFPALGVVASRPRPERSLKFVTAVIGAAAIDGFLRVVLNHVSRAAADAILRQPRKEVSLASASSPRREAAS